MLDIVIIVLRETLEASMLIGFLFVYSNYFSLGKAWLFGALGLGAIASVFIGHIMPEVSELWGGAGQELLFASVLFLLSLLILALNSCYIYRFEFITYKASLSILCSAIIVLAISLEGAEILIFYLSRSSENPMILSTVMGSILGLGIGISVGALGYFWLARLHKTGPNICFLLLTLVSAGMSAQAVAYLAQADLIDSGYPFWDTSTFIDERSVLGQLTYAIIGYEATPTIQQVCVYLGFILLPISIILFRKFLNLFKKNSENHEIN